MTRIFLLLTTVLAAALLCTCVTPPGDGDTGPVRLGMYADLSSIGARDGNDAVKGAQLRVDLANESGGVLGRRIELIVLDMKQNPTEAVKSYTALAQEKGVAAVIGSSVPNAGLAVSPVADLVHVPLVSLSIDDRVTTPDISLSNPDLAGAPRRFAFLVRPSAATLAASLASYAMDRLMLQRFATLYDPASPVAVLQARAFASAIRKGGRVVSRAVELPEGGLDAALADILAARTDALFICGSVEQGAAVARRAAEISFPPVLLGNQSWSEEGIALAGKAAEGLIFVTGTAPDEPGMAELAARYRSRYNEGPRVSTAPGWDAVGLILAAIRKTGSADPLKIRDALEQFTGYRGISGTFDMDRRTHRPNMPTVAIMRIFSGLIATLEPRFSPRAVKAATK